jgi:hypothetical protein
VSHAAQPPRRELSIISVDVGQSLTVSLCQFLPIEIRDNRNRLTSYAFFRDENLSAKMVTHCHVPGHMRQERRRRLTRVSLTSVNDCQLSGT